MHLGRRRPAQGPQAASSGHSLAAGNVSARYSQIASESQIARSPSLSTGTRWLGECLAISASDVPAWRSATTVSLNGCPVRFRASQGRSDQLDHFLVPTTISMASLLGERADPRA
jgi:hypothetical protein